MVPLKGGKLKIYENILKIVLFKLFSKEEASNSVASGLNLNIAANVFNFHKFKIKIKYKTDR